MPTEVIMPKVDMDMATGKISRWLKAEGAAVKQGEPLFEIETDKAAMEVEAPASGTLGDVTANEGAEIPVGLAVAWIYAEGEARGASKKLSQAAVASVVHAAPTAIHTPAPAPVDGTRATPLARRLARQRNLDLAQLSGSGPYGRIQAQDVMGAASRPEAKAPVTRREAVSTPGATWLRQGDGVPIVLIHGFGSETASWRPFLAAFEHPGPILALDLPGHGGSLNVEADGFDGLVAHVESQLGSHGVTIAHLVGHSLGGAVAAAVAAGSAIEARSLFLLAPAGFGPEINTKFTTGIAAVRDEESLRCWMRELVTDPAVFTDSFVKAAARTRADGRAAEAQTRLAARLFSDGSQSFSVRATLNHLAIPIKVIAGNADHVVPCQHTAGLGGQVALHLFPGLGHMPHLEDRANIARLLRELIRAAAI